MAIKFDPTVNAGNLLQFGAALIAVAVAFSVLDRRISVLEERSGAALVAASDRQTEQKESLKEIKTDIKELQRSLNEVSRAVATKPTTQDITNAVKGGRP